MTGADSDVIVIGADIYGLSAARRLTASGPGLPRADSVSARRSA